MIYVHLIFKSQQLRKFSIKLFKKKFYLKINHLFVNRPSKKYVYGSRYNIDLNIKIENKKEDAFEAQCHVTLPYGVDYVKAFISQNINVSIILVYLSSFF